MEAVYNGQIDLTSLQNRTLTKVLGPIINNSLFRRTGIQKTIEWKGEQDMVNFITQMAKKFKDGTFTQEDFNAIRKDRTILKNENPTEIDKQYDIYNQSKITNNSNESSDDNKGVSKISKITADNLNRIYAENPGSTDIIFEVGTELMTTKALDDKGNIKVIPGDGFIGKLVDKRRGVPKFNEKREEIMFEAAYGDISGGDAYKKGRNKILVYQI